MLLVSAILTALLAAVSLLPFLPFAHGLVRVGDFPRQQILAVALGMLAAGLLFGGGGPAWWTLGAVLIAIATLQLWFILEFTPLWRRESADFDPASDHGEPVRLVASNVKMSNDRHAGLAREIAARDPDILVLMEVDQAWIDALSDLIGTYPHQVLRPQDNSYGMALCSRFALEDTSVECLLTEGVPSIVATVVMPEGQRFRLYSIHPEPPVPHEETVGRDGETSLVALRVREEALPVIVTGDLNDVAWSRTTRRFRKISRLLDPRVGRRIFSTFDARFPLIRWPLDHLFHSAEFRLKRMERLPGCGSDHFPVMFELVLCPTEEAEGRPEQADGEDIERARDLVEQAGKRDDAPIGDKWER